MSKKTKKEEIDVVAEGFCAHYECDTCVDKYSCDYYINVFCQSTSGDFDRYGNNYRGDGYGGDYGYNDGFGYGQGSFSQGQLQQNRQNRIQTDWQDRQLCDGQNQGGQPQEQCCQQPQQQQSNASAGYGYTANVPVNAPGGANGVQLSPIIIPVSFVPYTTQNQPLYQVETVMPEKEFVKHHGLSLFMLALSIFVFFAIAFPAISEYTGYNILGGISEFIGVFGFADGGGFADIFASGNTTLVIGACLASVSILTVFLTAIYNTVKYIVKSINGRLKKGPNKSNVLMFFGVIALFVSAIVLNVGDGRAVMDAIGSLFAGDAGLAYKMNFSYFALLGISLLLMFTNAFIKTERYAEVEGALPPE
jgi:hypothetical protein